MKKTHLAVQKEFCDECSLALMHFIGKMDGVEEISSEDGKVAITFDDAKIPEELLLKLTRENIEKLGYHIINE
ncbi:MAG: heavy-metal-associated domain-containing protein [Thermodesulfovibrionales bacterium]